MKLARSMTIAAMFAMLLPVMAQASGTVGGVFLLIGTSARCEGMGGACVAVVNDASAVNMNPGAMSEVKGRQALFMHNETLLDLSQDYITYTSTTGNRSMGASLVYMDMGSQQGYTTTNQPTGSFRPNSYAFSLAYGMKMTREMSWGAGFKYIREKIASDKGTAFAIDAGLLYKPAGAPWRAGVVVQNLGTKLKLGTASDPLPLTIKVGGAYTMPKMPLTFTGDVFTIKNADPEYHLGAEYVINNFVAIRAGYNSDDDLDNGYTFGLGVSQEKFGLDYAFIPMGVFGDSHRFSFSTKF